MITDKLAQWFKHPLHPIMVHVPVAMWLSTLVFDLLSLLNVGGNAMVRLAFYSIAFGLAGALLAVPTGVMDWSGVKKENPAWRLGLYHMALNLMAAIVYAINLGLRLETFRDAAQVSAGPLILSVVGVSLLIVSAFLGGLMVYDYGVGVARFSKEKWRGMAGASGANLPPAPRK